MSEDQRKHLEFIQAVISRMAGNSFLIRGWTVTLVAGLFALAAKDADRSFIVVGYFPCLMFWCLDAYYLSQERKFRSLYDSVCAAPSTHFNMNTDASQGPWDGWRWCFLSPTMLLFHGSIIAVITVVMVTLSW
jgi:hypothetical protein